MSSTTAVTNSNLTTDAAHPIRESVIRSIADTQDITPEELNDALNLYQGVFATDYDLADHFSQLDSPSKRTTTITTTPEEQPVVTALVTPIVWAELAANIPPDNDRDAAVIKAHRQEFKARVKSSAGIDDNELEAFHPVVAYTDL